MTLVEDHSTAIAAVRAEAPMVEVTDDPEVVRRRSVDRSALLGPFMAEGTGGLLAEAVPNLPLGFDPCHEGAIDRLIAHKDFRGFVAEAVAPFPRAKMIYLEYRIVLFASEHGFDLVDAFHEAGKTIDAYTLKLADAATARIAERLLALKVDQITTDDPVGLDRLLRG